IHCVRPPIAYVGDPPMSRRLLVLPVVALLWTLIAAPSPAFPCPFCNAQGQTLTKEMEVSLVVFGTIQDSDPGRDYADGSTKFAVEKIIKKHDILDKELKGKQTVTLPSFIPKDKESK